MTTDLIRLATQRWTTFVAPSEPTAPRLTKAQLAEIVGQPVAKGRLWKTNWRNRLYQVQLADGSQVVVKQVSVGTVRELATEYDSLRRLRQLKLRHVQAPRPRGFSREHKAYAMDWSSGKRLDHLVSARPREALAKLVRVGTALGQIHRHWTHTWMPFPVDELAADFAAVPWKLTVGQHAQLHRQLDELHDKRIPVGQPYLDFKLSNILFDRSAMVLVDPPEVSCNRGILAWDAAVFRQSLLMSQSVLRSLTTPCRPTYVEAGKRFQQAYLNSMYDELSNRDVAARVILVLELQRLGQLIALQRSRIRRIQCTASTSRIARRASCIRAEAAARLLTRRARRLLLRTDC